jgi:hypothetical protein
MRGRTRSGFEQHPATEALRELKPDNVFMAAEHSPAREEGNNGSGTAPWRRAAAATSRAAAGFVARA